MPKGHYQRKPKKEEEVRVNSPIFHLAKARTRIDVIKEIEQVLLSDIVPQDPRMDPLVKVYDELCNRQRESQDYFLPIGLSPWQVRQTILTVKQLGTDVERNVVLRRLIEEITRSIMKVILDGNYGKNSESD